MKKSRLPALLVLLGFLAGTLPAANVFVWNKDPSDTWYDSDIGQTINCAYWVQRTLEDQGHTVTVATTLATELDQYDAVFLLTGWYRC